MLPARSSDRFKMAVGSGYATHQHLLLQLSLLADHWVTSAQGPTSRLAAAQISPTGTKTRCHLGPLGPVVGGAPWPLVKQELLVVPTQ